MIVASAVLFSHSATGDETPPGQLISSPAELLKLFTNNTFTGTIPGFEGTWAEYYCANGTSIYLYEGHLQLGRWRVQNDKTCFAYDSPGYDKELCVSAYRQDNGGFIFHSNERVESFVQTSFAKPPRPGDPLHLRNQTKYGCDKEPTV